MNAVTTNGRRERVPPDEAGHFSGGARRCQGGGGGGRSLRHGVMTRLCLKNEKLLGRRAGLSPEGIKGDKEMCEIRR